MRSGLVGPYANAQSFRGGHAASQRVRVAQRTDTNSGHLHAGGVGDLAGNISSFRARRGKTPTILVVNDVEETRDCTEKLLLTDGYRVDPARNEDDAVDRINRRRPDLILVSLAGSPVDVIVAVARIRERAGLNKDVPVVVFCLPIEEGAEVAIGSNVYVTWPDSFDQLRVFLRHLLLESTGSG
jgi:CheY-like chemotaxis protein